MKLALMVALTITISSCTSGNLEEVKRRAPEVWSNSGFDVVGYQGYQNGLVIPFSSYGGACVWYTLKKHQDNGITYQGCLQRWGSEFHVYSLKAVDAVRP